MTPQTYCSTFSFTHVPAVMKRGRHALIVLQDEHGNYILGVKDIYPQGIYRLIGGGLDDGEDPQVGASRELEEEMGIHTQPSDLSHLATITAKIHETTTNKHYSFTTYLYHVRANTSDLHPADDLDGMKAFSKEEMIDLINRYNQLPSDLAVVAKQHDGKAPAEFRWSDYGALYGRIHEIALKLTQ